VAISCGPAKVTERAGSSPSYGGYEGRIFVSELGLPRNLKLNQHLEIGARDNLSVEGLAFAPNVL